MVQDDNTYAQRIDLSSNPEYQAKYTQLVRKRDAAVGRAMKNLEKARANNWPTNHLEDPSVVRTRYDNRLVKLHERFSVSRGELESKVDDAEESFTPAVLLRSGAEAKTDSPFEPATGGSTSYSGETPTPRSSERLTTYLAAKQAECTEARTRFEKLEKTVRRLEEMHARYVALNQVSDTDLAIQSSNERLDKDTRKFLELLLPGGLERKTTADEYYLVFVSN